MLVTLLINSSLYFAVLDKKGHLLPFYPKIGRIRKGGIVQLILFFSIARRTGVKVATTHNQKLAAIK